MFIQTALAKQLSPPVLALDSAYVVRMVSLTTVGLILHALGYLVLSGFGFLMAARQPAAKSSELPMAWVSRLLRYCSRATRSPKRAM